jgi:glucose/arabinose dehydrogenase
MTLRAIVTVAIVSLLAVAAPARAAIQLIPVATGLSNPLFVGHAGDGSGRLFIVERGGTIRVMQQGASPTLFLDIRTKVFSNGGEQGLLGLAFHPNYATNHRFFVYYTTVQTQTLAAGTIVLAEYTITNDPMSRILRRRKSC